MECVASRLGSLTECTFWVHRSIGVGIVECHSQHIAKTTVVSWEGHASISSTRNKLATK